MRGELIEDVATTPAGSFTRTGIETRSDRSDRRTIVPPAGSFTRTGIETEPTLHRKIENLRPQLAHSPEQELRPRSGIGQAWILALTPAGSFTRTGIETDVLSCPLP